MALQNVAWALTGRGLMDCLQYYDNCLFLKVFSSNFKYKLLVINHIICDKVYNSSTKFIRITSLELKIFMKKTLFFLITSFSECIYFKLHINVSYYHSTFVSVQYSSKTISRIMPLLNLDFFLRNW